MILFISNSGCANKDKHLWSMVKYVILFDIAHHSTLNASFLVLGVVADSSSFDQSKRLRTGGDYTHAGYGSPAPFHPHPPPGPVWGPPG